MCVSLVFARGRHCDVGRATHYSSADGIAMVDRAQSAGLRSRHYDSASQQSSATLHGWNCIHACSRTRIEVRLTALRPHSTTPTPTSSLTSSRGSSRRSRCQCRRRGMQALGRSHAWTRVDSAADAARPRPRHAARLAALVRSWWRDNKNVYSYGRHSVSNSILTGSF